MPPTWCCSTLACPTYACVWRVRRRFGTLEVSVAFLVQIDKLVQLFESPILTHVRLQLLEPEIHPHLLKALWGILMLLPQSPVSE